MEKPENPAAPSPPEKKPRRKRSPDLIRGQKGPGRPPRVPNPPDPMILARQIRHYELHVDGASVAAVARNTGHNRDTVALDIEMEGQRRFAERRFNAGRSTEIAIERYEGVITRSRIRIGQMTAKAQGILLDPNDPAKGYRRGYEPDLDAQKTCVFEERNIIQAQKRIDELQGLRPVKAPEGQGSAENGPLDALAVIGILTALPVEDRIAALRAARERREAMKNVTPVPVGQKATA